MTPGRQHALVKIYWEGPFTVSEVIARTDAKHKGVYQVYGDHAVFGPNSLLYVGMTDDQTFGVRFEQHHQRWLRYDTGVEIRLGYIREPSMMDMLKHVEALTIWWHAPPYNSKNIWRYNGPELHVQNWDERGRLHPEYSSHWGKPDLLPPDDEPA